MGTADGEEEVVFFPYIKRRYVEADFKAKGALEGGAGPHRDAGGE